METKTFYARRGLALAAGGFLAMLGLAFIALAVWMRVYASVPNAKPDLLLVGTGLGLIAISAFLLRYVTNSRPTIILRSDGFSIRQRGNRHKLHSFTWLELRQVYITDWGRGTRGIYLIVTPDAFDREQVRPGVSRQTPAQKKIDRMIKMDKLDPILDRDHSLMHGLLDHNINTYTLANLLVDYATKAGVQGYDDATEGLKRLKSFDWKAR